jgi:CopG family transcriptional regulator/antitoxin EndoAI
MRFVLTEVAMNKRLNITLPEQTVRLMDRVAGRGRRSSLIDRAVRRYLKEETRASLRKRLAESYRSNASFDLQLAEDWFPIDEDAWPAENR